MPVRIQLRRAKGWRMPPNTVKVDRTTKWGNPFIIGRGQTQTEAVQRFEYMCGGYICITSNTSIDEQRAYLKRAIANIHKLRGKNLACWCRPDQPCHADVLLRAAAKRGK